MSDDYVSAEEARRLREAAEMAGSVTFSTRRLVTAECGLREIEAAADLMTASPRLARTVEHLHARLAEVRAELRERPPRGMGERELLRRLWQRIDGEQEGDAPGNQAMEDGLVRLFDEMRADVERCAADENASTQEAERLRAERDEWREQALDAQQVAIDTEVRLGLRAEELERALRVENGDPLAGPDGWVPTTRGWRRADMLVTRRWMFGTCVRVAVDEDGHVIDGSATDHPNAWDAMTRFDEEE